MRKLNHFGIPTSTPQPNEIYEEGLKVYLTDFSKSPNKIEYLRFMEGSCMDPLIQTVPHIAYEVDDLEKAVEGAKILFPITACSDTLRIAFVEEEGIPVELMEIKKA